MNEMLTSLTATLQALLLLVSSTGATEEASNIAAAVKSVNTIVQQQEEVVPLNTLNTSVGKSLVNILCTTKRGGAFNPISGSGVIIDSRGVILTNAHVAQYVLLQGHLQNNPIKCSVRMDAPAKAKYTANVLFMPESWVNEYANSIREELPTGTGEGDYALLLITGRTDGKPLQSIPFPAVDFNLQREVANAGTQVLLSGYPAGFLGGAIIQRSLWPVSTITTIKKLMTFKTGSVDMFSLGGSIVAQSGSSGGTVVNKYGELIGIITTSSQALSTDKRDLRAVTIHHIDRSIISHTGSNLNIFLQTDLKQLLATFEAEQKENLLNIYKSVFE